MVQGHSHIKWHLPHSIHSEHRGRTPKCPIANHRVEYNYGKLVPVRIAIDKSNFLSECPIELEVIQEFPLSGSHAVGSRDEKITLGRLTLNLAEYVEESEAVLRETGYRARGPSSLQGGGGTGANSGAQAAHVRKRSSLSASTPIMPPDATSSSPKRSPSPKTTPKPDSKSGRAPGPPPNEPAGPPDVQVEDGIIRRYLMSDSKINSTLKVGILMVQLDGERNFVAPPLKTAAVFGGIAGVTGSSSHPNAEDFGLHFHDSVGGGAGVAQGHDTADLGAQFPSSASAGAGGKGGGSGGGNRDVYELQDMYRRALAASWACQPGELPADECIEDIFGGGDGFGPDGLVNEKSHGSTAGDVTPRGGHRSHSSFSHVGGGGGGSGSGGGGGGSGGSGSGSGSMRWALRREDSGSSTVDETNDFLRPGHHSPKRGGQQQQQRRHHARHGSGESTNTLRHDNGASGSAGGLGIQGNGAHGGQHQHRSHQQHHNNNHHGHRRDSSKDSTGLRGGMMGMGMRSRSESMASLTGTIESERGRGGFKSAREVTEWDVRDDLVAWKLPGTAS